jgi:hypothetical protein
VRAGDEVRARPDFVIAYDFPGYTDVIFRQMKDEFGIDRVDDPKRFVMFIDHMVPAVTPQEEDLHQNTRDWGRANDVPVVERKGIGHQVASELGYATPGAFAVHFDGHISQLGTFGTLAIGVRRHLLEAFVKDSIKIKVPQTTRVDLVGRLQPGVMARDVFHHIVRVLGPASCRFQVLELGGSAMAHLGIESRQTITCLAMFTGAIAADGVLWQPRLDAREEPRRMNRMTTPAAAATVAALMREAVAVTRGHRAAGGGETVLEASGGLTLADAAEVGATGVHFVAVGAITHSAPVLDVGLDFLDD